MKRFFVYILISILSITSVTAQTYQISFHKKSNDYRAYVTVKIPNNVTLEDVVIDTGASCCTLNKSDYNTLNKSGNLTYVGKATLRTISGQTVSVNQYRIKRITIGNVTLEDVDVVFSGKRVIGQNVLSAFNTYTINNKAQTIILER